MKRSCREGDCLRHQWRHKVRGAGLPVVEEEVEEEACVVIEEVREVLHNPHEVMRSFLSMQFK